MMRTNVYRLATAMLGILVQFVVGSVCAAAQRPEDLGVIPTPQEVTWTNESLRVDEATKIVLPEKPTEGAKFAAGNLQERLRQQTGLNLQIAREPGAVKAPKLIAIGDPKTDPRVAELMKAYGL